MQQFISRLLIAFVITALLALGLWVMTLRINFCMSASDLSWWQCFFVMGAK